jgi:hypothetical protein
MKKLAFVVAVTLATNTMSTGITCYRPTIDLSVGKTELPIDYSFNTWCAVNAPGCAPLITVKKS